MRVQFLLLRTNGKAIKTLYQFNPQQFITAKHILLLSSQNKSVSIYLGIYFLSLFPVKRNGLFYLSTSSFLFI